MEIALQGISILTVRRVKTRFLEFVFKRDWKKTERVVTSSVAD